MNRVKADKKWIFFFCILDMTVEGKKITLLCLYRPNEDNPQFYENIRQKVVEFENEQVIMCGDWNLILTADKD